MKGTERHVDTLFYVSDFDPEAEASSSSPTYSTGTFYDRETMEPYSGRIVMCFDKNKTKVSMRAALKDGLFHGPRYHYHTNGQHSNRENWSDGKMDGPQRAYYENGQLRGKHTCSKGKTVGLWEGYYENGELRSRGFYSNGNRCGEWIEDGETVTYDPCLSN